MSADKRTTNRQMATATGVLVVQKLEIPIQLKDVSPGGCKIKLPAQVSELFVKLLPCEVTLQIAEQNWHATALWFINDLLGCRFPRQLSLNEVAVLMAGKPAPEKGW